MKLASKLTISFVFLAAFMGITTILSVHLSQQALQNTMSEADITTLSNFLMVVSATTGGLAVLMGVLVSRTISKPLADLKNYVRDIEAGKLDSTISLEGDDEIYELAKSFDSLVHSLNKSTSQVHAVERKYKNLYEESYELYHTIDENGIIIDCNKKFADRLGYLKSAIIGSQIFKYVAEQDHDTMRQHIESWRKTSSLKNKQVLLKAKNGNIFPVVLNGNNVYNEKGKLIGVNTVCLCRVNA